MNQTPRLRSSYPATPESLRRTTAQNGAPAGIERRRSELPKMPQATTNSPSSSPLIPLAVVDAPSQRFYVFALYGLLLAWRLYDWGKLVEDEADSFWLFIKWVAIDGVFLYGLPGMRIPWLEWSNPMITSIFLVHAIINGILMFRVPLPIDAALAAVVKTLYDRELSISENRVKPASILHNSSLIMGRQIINVLPEGSVTLNPDHASFCIGDGSSTIKLPIWINQTSPTTIELLRIDFDSNRNETIDIKQKEIKSMRKLAEKRRPKGDTGALILEYNVKKTGLYRLKKVIDESKLEVQRHTLDTIVVACPTATIKPSSADRCIGDLSDLTIDVQGTAPLKIAYSRTINYKDQSSHSQVVQPNNLVSSLVGASDALTLTSMNENVSWGRSSSIDVQISESMTTSGTWLYSIDEIHDAAQNVANFSARGEDGEHIYPRGSHLEHALIVHKRPQISLGKCSSNSPLKVAKGRAKKLPIEFGNLDTEAEKLEHVISWQFSPIETLTADGDHGNASIIESFLAKDDRQQPDINKAGLYTLRSIRSSFCDGEILEPASCLLINPPKPDLTITAEDIYDKCAGSSIGLLVDLDLVGTPPFRLYYDIVHDSKEVTPTSTLIHGSRYQLPLKPTDAGHFTYRFTSIDDSVYSGESLRRKSLILEQDVKPQASAEFIEPSKTLLACIDEPANSDVQLQGEYPFILEYELVHDGKRTKHKVKDIKTELYTISTGPLHQGGEYSLALTSVQDKTGCRIFLKGEVKIEVRRQRPKASFARLEGKRTTMMLEGEKIQLPLRLEGEPPWQVIYQNTNEPDQGVMTSTLRSSNALLEVSRRGVYQLVDVSDKSCPGTIDGSAAVFSVDWIPRPELSISDLTGLTSEGGKLLKRQVCEGDLDTIEIGLTGSPPFRLKYQQRHKPPHGSQSVSNKEIDVKLGTLTIPMDTTKAGQYTYTFSELSDNSYDHEAGKLSPIIVDQIVNPKPSAQFIKPSQSYKYCKEEEAGYEVIPIDLKGTPPFYVEIDIKHQSSSRPETVKIANVETKQFDFRIPHGILSLGTYQVSVRKVRDSHGCQQKSEHGMSHGQVQVRVYDVPSIYPLDSRMDYCVGDRLSYTLSGTPPFDIHYLFDGVERKAKSPNINFRRIAEKPGDFVITAISDKASECKAIVEIKKTIHEMPSVKLSKGRQTSIDIHEGGQAEILFEFWGTPPFEFTYTRSTNAKKGHKSQVLETKHDISYEYSKSILSSQEGTYEVVAIKDQYCSFSTQKMEGKSSQKMLQY